MDATEIRRLLMTTAEDILDESGNVIGYVAQPARFRLNRPYLARGGFLVVQLDEATREYVGTEFDALPHPRTAQPYPAGHSEVVWRTRLLDTAVALVCRTLEQPFAVSPETEPG